MMAYILYNTLCQDTRSRFFFHQGFSHIAPNVHDLKNLRENSLKTKPPSR